METAGVRELVREELRRIKTPEKKFHSPHEAWAVLTEEVEEADKELAKVITGNTLLKDMVFEEYSGSDLVEQLNQIKANAINLSAEAVQVAAVCDKFIEFLDARKSVKTWSEFFNEWKDKDAVMHCKTEEAREFCNIMKNQGRTWNDGASYDNTFYEVYKDKICYGINCGLYSDTEFYEEKGSAILEFSDYKEIKDD